jgi:hypothetical protein
MAAHAKVSVLASLPLGTEEIPKQWDGYHLDKKRAIIDALMTVTVMPAPRGRPAGFKADASGKPGSYFDNTLIKVDWKTPDGPLPMGSA